MNKKNIKIRFNYLIFLLSIIIICAIIFSGCSNETVASKEEQRNSFLSWQQDFRSYSTVLNDYTKKLEKIKKMLDDKTLDKNQAISNLENLEKDLNGFNLMLHDKWDTPKKLKDEHKEKLTQSIFAFEDCLISYEDASKELRVLIMKNLPVNSSEFDVSINFAKNSYQKSFNLQKQVEDDLK